MVENMCKPVPLNSAFVGYVAWAPISVSKETLYRLTHHYYSRPTRAVSLLVGRSSIRADVMKVEGGNQQEEIALC